MSTQPSETHRKLAKEVIGAYKFAIDGYAAQLIADSEARAVDGAMRDTPWAANYIDMERELATEREKVRVLRGALEKVQHIGETELLHYAGMHGDSPHQVAYIAKSALAATEGKT